MKKFLKKLFIILTIPLLLGLNSCGGKEVSAEEAKEIKNDIDQYISENRESIESLSFEFKQNTVTKNKDGTNKKNTNLKKDDETMYVYTHNTHSKSDLVHEVESYYYIANEQYYRNGEVCDEMIYKLNQETVRNPISLTSYYYNQIRGFIQNSLGGFYGESTTCKFYSSGEGDLSVKIVTKGTGPIGDNVKGTQTTMITIKDYLLTSYSDEYKSSEYSQKTTIEMSYNVKIKNPYL